MNEEFNPYANPQNPQNLQDQPVQQPSEPQNVNYRPEPAQQLPQPNYYQPQPPVPPQPPFYAPQPYYPQPPLPPRPASSGAAKAFSLISFIAGFFSLFLFMEFLVGVGYELNSMHAGYYEASSYYGTSFGYSIIISLPGLIFGILSLVKKTPHKAFGILGVIFNALPLAAFFIYIMLMPLTHNTYNYYD